MSMLIAALMFVVLLAIALAHFLWSIGRTWPIRNPDLLAKSVIGVPGITRVPKLAAFAISLMVLAAGVAALALADKTGGGVWLSAAGVVLALVFLGRGAVGYTAGWRATFSDEPFATLDRKNYSPIALALGAGFLALVVMRLL